MDGQRTDPKTSERPAGGGIGGACQQLEFTWGKKNHSAGDVFKMLTNYIGVVYVTWATGKLPIAWEYNGFLRR